MIDRMYLCWWNDLKIMDFLFTRIKSQRKKKHCVYHLRAVARIEKPSKHPAYDLLFNKMDMLS